MPAPTAFVTDSNRPQPLWQPPPTACLTASRAASEVPSLLLHPWGGRGGVRILADGPGHKATPTGSGHCSPRAQPQAHGHRRRARRRSSRCKERNCGRPPALPYRRRSAWESFSAPRRHWHGRRVPRLPPPPPLHTCEALPECTDTPNPEDQCLRGLASPDVLSWPRGSVEPHSCTTLRNKRTMA